MICPHCKQEIPANLIACPCFQKRADEETRRLAVIAFSTGHAPLYLTNQRNGRHLLGRRDRTKSLCGQKSFKQPQTTPLWRHTFEKLHQNEICIECAALVTRSFAETVK